MSPEGAAWLSEMWGYCHELSRRDRMEKLTSDRERQRLAEEWATDVHSGPVDAQPL